MKEVHPMKISRILTVAAVMAINIFLDQITKLIAVNFLRGSGTIRVIGDLFILRYAENEGAFLGMGSGLPPVLRLLLLIILPVIMLVGLTVYVIRKHQMPLIQVIAFSTITGGGISNIFERIVNDGRVIDFMNFGIGNLRTGILNVADLSVTAGAIILLISLLTEKKPEPDDS